jgi:hypothetical protein
LACGADILFAEALTARGAQLHVWLPFSLDEFKAVSVRTGGASWLRRFEDCLAQATSVSYATTSAYAGDERVFATCGRRAMSHALRQAASQSAEAEQIVVWDGREPFRGWGTAADVKHWRQLGHPTRVIPVRTLPIAVLRTTSPHRDS